VYHSQKRIYDVFPSYKRGELLPLADGWKMRQLQSGDLATLQKMKYKKTDYYLEAII